MTGRVVALSGGIGGAKLALGLDRILPDGDLTVICNSGDDFEHLGLTVCPDVDTVLYTLSGQSNRTLGWGREGETWTFMDALRTLGGETWFQLGDGDLATHVERTRRLTEGQTLSQITAEFARAFGIGSQILPMCDAHVRTIVQTPDGPLPFQRYFVEQQCAPVVTGFEFEGAASAKVSDAIAGALDHADLRAIILCPSNPLISIDPILSVPGLRDILMSARAPIVAVSPIIGGQAIKGPTAKMMQELGIPRTNSSIAQHYGDLLYGLVIDNVDADDAEMIDVACLATTTLMTSDADKERLARGVLTFADSLR